MKKFFTFFAVVIVLGLTACSGNIVSRAELKNEGEYWQRSEASSAIYQRGPKAQQMLHRDISRCVTELRELRALGAIREELIAPSQRRVANEQRMDVWQQPARIGSLHAEYLPYHDFEGCMNDDGWERVENLPYEISERARDNYIETLTGQRRRTPFANEQTRNFFPEAEGEWENLNN